MSSASASSVEIPVADSEIDVSVVVPVYGGMAALPELCERVGRTMREAGWRYEIILVDDHGPGNAWPVIVELARMDPQVIGLRLSKNFGQHAATMCGINRARGEWVVTMDDDLEHPPESIPAMVAAGTDGCRLVYGAFGRRTHAAYRNISSDLMRWTLKRAFPDLNENYCSFRAIHSSVARQLSAFSLSKPYIDGMLSWITSGARSVEVSHSVRTHGESAYTLKKLVAHAVNIFVTFSPLPLRMATYGGLGLAGVSFLSIIYFVYGKLSGTISNPGYTSLMSVVLFACGIQLVILGVLGEYVGKLMSAAYKRPGYIVIEEAHPTVSASTPGFAHQSEA
nr:glycosyltransferase family 2 protein [Dyella humicola]